MSRTADLPPTRVICETNDAALADRWHRWLVGAGFQFVDGAADDVRSLDAGAVIVTDRRPGAGASASDEQPSERFARPAGVGLVYVGTGDFETADACLNSECSPQELALACRLVAVIARQRQQLDHGARDRQRLTAAALTDPLTGLPNRRAWDERLPQFVAACEQGRSACLGLIDLDLFKAVNDAHGHAMGDRVLQTAARALRANLRHSDFLARLGGDEFGVMLCDVAAATAAVIVERARAAVHQALERDGVSGVTASAGVVVCTPDAPTAKVQRPRQLFESADRGLLKAKQTGRNRMVVEVVG